MGERFNRNVLFTCLGSPGKPVVDTAGPLLLQPGDRVLLCSDGLWGTRRATPIITEQLARQPISDAVPELVEQALRSGGAKQRQRHRAGASSGKPPRTATARSGISTAVAGRRGLRLHHPGQLLGDGRAATSSTKPRSSARSARSTRPSSARPQTQTT